MSRVMNQRPESVDQKRFRRSLSVKAHLVALLLVSLCCAVLAVGFATTYYEAFTRGDNDCDYILELKKSFCWWSPWIAATPFMLIVCRRFTFRKGAWRVPLVVHTLCGVAVGEAVRLIQSVLMKSNFGVEIMPIGIGPLLMGYITYLAFAAAFHGLDYYRLFREREVRASQLEVRLARAQLDMLKMQLHPHFLFNTLHAISTLMHRDIDAAEAMIIKLSDLLRLSLEANDEHEVPLRKELDFLKGYLDIEQIRFGERLTVDLNIAPEARGAHVPNLILQPIVENAVNHGVGKILSQGRIWLHVRKAGETLKIEVGDNGPGLPVGSDSPVSRTGLANTRARLEQLYGQEGRLVFRTPEGGGLVVQITIPFHTKVKT